MSPRDLERQAIEALDPRDEEHEDPSIARLAAATWYVLTPCGLAGPYPSQEAANCIAKPLGFPVLRRLGGGAR